MRAYPVLTYIPLSLCVCCLFVPCRRSSMEVRGMLTHRLGEGGGDGPPSRIEAAFCRHQG